MVGTPGRGTARIVNTLPLTLGRVIPAPTTLQRSGMRWLVPDGAHCRAGDVVAYCNVGVRGGDALLKSSLAGEQRDWQIALALTVPGLLRRGAGASRGGFLDQMQYYDTWREDDAIGTLELDAATDVPAAAFDPLVFAGHRALDIAEVRTGLFTGWHDRARAWWGGTGAPFGTLACLGICEQRNIIRGESGAFLELFAAVQGPAHVVHYPDDALVPAAPILLDQIARTPAQQQAIVEDIARSFGAGPAVPGGRDFMMLGALVNALVRSPLTESLAVTAPTAVTTVDHPDAILLSVLSESSLLLRHKRLGYWMQIHGYRLGETGPAFHAWLRANFEQVRRSLADVARDLGMLIDAVRARGTTQVLVLNAVSTLGTEQVQCYAPFPRPLGKTLGTVRARETNAMLHDLSRSHGIRIVDGDALAAEYGARQHIPDRVHSSGVLQQATRDEIVRILREGDVPGFEPRERRAVTR